MLDNLPRGTICIEDIEMGMSRHLRKVVSDGDIEMFAQVSTDHNPVHLDDEYAQNTIKKNDTGQYNGTQWSVNDIICMAVDLDNGKIVSECEAAEQQHYHIQNRLSRRKQMMSSRT